MYAFCQQLLLNYNSLVKKRSMLVPSTVGAPLLNHALPFFHACPVNLQCMGAKGPHSQ